MLCHYLFVEGFLMWILDNVLYSHYSLSEICQVFDVLSYAVFDNELSRLISIMLEEVIDNEFIDIK
jgi:hypothetical protein